MRKNKGTSSVPNDCFYKDSNDIYLRHTWKCTTYMFMYSLHKGLSILSDFALHIIATGMMLPLSQLKQKERAVLIHWQLCPLITMLLFPSFV